MINSLVKLPLLFGDLAPKMMNARALIYCPCRRITQTFLHSSLVAGEAFRQATLDPEFEVLRRGIHGLARQRAGCGNITGLPEQLHPLCADLRSLTWRLLYRLERHLCLVNPAEIDQSLADAEMG